jgi:AcrR family transcriptional regulator
MSRPVTIRDDVILKAAREVFLLHGFKARSSLIAKEAGVSEGTIFKRFKTKAHLFIEAMGNEEQEQKWIDDLTHAPGTRTVRENLLEAASHIIDHMEVTVPRMMSLRSSGVSIPPSQDLKHRPSPEVHSQALATYFREEVELGRLQLANPVIYAYMFVGSVVHYVMNKQFNGHAVCSRLEFINALVDLHLGSLKKTAVAPVDPKPVLEHEPS